ncbi:tail sheath [Burkholderia phage Bm1]
MAISIKRYVDITSGVGGASIVATRELIGRIVTTSDKLAPGTVAEITTLDDVGTLFGLNSPEYAYATKYFAYISKAIKKPKKISFVRQVSAATAPQIAGDTTAKDLNSLKAINAGNIQFAINDAAPVTVGPIDLSAQTTLAGMATKLQADIISWATTNASPMLQTCTVTYNAATNQFNIVGGVQGAGTLVALDAETQNIGSLVGWTTPGAVDTAGSDAQTPMQAISASASISDNFGSFSFINGPLADQDIIAVGAWNHAQNNKFIYCAMVPRSRAASLQPQLAGFSGLALHSVPDANLSNPDYVENAPMEVLAATDYTLPAASQNYMYQIFANRKATVFTDTEADALDAMRVNYIGQTQTAGQKLEFYQRGLLQGSSTAAVDMNTYANEMWLKDRLTSDLLNMFLSLPSVSANEIGRTQLMGIVQPGLQDAKTNGTISVGKPLTAVQKAYISQITEDPTAWHQVQTAGYWIDVQLQSFVNSITNATEWKAVFTLIYSKDDQIRKVEGSDILI